MRIGQLRARANATIMRTLVIQLGRLGDVIQTTPLLAELATVGDEVDVLVLRSAHEPLLGFSAVANIITIPDSLKPLDDAIACGFPLGKIPAEAHELLADLKFRSSIHSPTQPTPRSAACSPAQSLAPIPTVATGASSGVANVSS